MLEIALETYSTELPTYVCGQLNAFAGHIQLYCTNHLAISVLPARNEGEIELYRTAFP